MSRFLFEWDVDPASDTLRGSIQQRQLILMTANEFWILTGCAQCGARLVEKGKPIPGARMVYPPGTNQETAVGTPLCARCFRKVVK
jgi:hypothetical protein